LLLNIISREKHYKEMKDFLFFKMINFFIFHIRIKKEFNNKIKRLEIKE